MGAWGIQLGTKKDMDRPVIGTIYCYGFKEVESDKEGLTSITLDEDITTEEYEVVEVREAPNGCKMYITNQWNNTFNDIQVVPEFCVAEFIEHSCRES